ncbi:MAG: hypothetical protein EA413_11745 [Cyanobium sp. PLM2.Bin73]|nr:MAG: hypothetical protein EA413_11745 [Cyanobium sp. PLM2.Bin73]
MAGTIAALEAGQSQERKLLQRSNKLIAEISRDPFHEIGKPEPLRHALAGYWNRQRGAPDRAVPVSRLSSIEQRHLTFWVILPEVRRQGQQLHSVI